MTAHPDRVELRREARHPIELTTIAEHRRLGEFTIRLINLSAGGCLAEGLADLDVGERIVVRLPLVGRIEAHQSWSARGRSGLKFERVIRLDDLTELVSQLQPAVEERRCAA